MTVIAKYKGPALIAVLKEIAEKDGNPLLQEACASAVVRIEQLEKLDREASNYVECPIVMRTDFTGEQPYVGWKGLGLALNEALDERDALLMKLAETSRDPEIVKKAAFVARNYASLRKVNNELLARVDLLEGKIKILYKETISETENDDVFPQKDSVPGEGGS